MVVTAGPSNLQSPVPELKVSVLYFLLFLLVDLIGFAGKGNETWLLLGTYFEVCGFFIQEKTLGMSEIGLEPDVWSPGPCLLPAQPSLSDYI